MSDQEQGMFSLVGEQYVGCSQVLGVSAIPGQVACVVRWIAGGTFSIIGSTAGAWNGSNAFYMPTDVPFPMDMVGTYWLAFAGVTTTVHVLKGKSAGF